MNPSALLDELSLSEALLGACTVNPSARAWKDAEAAGWDMTLVADALRKDAAHRVEQHGAALALAESLIAAYQQQYGDTRASA